MIAPGSRSANSVTSAPAENARPSPARTSARLARTSFESSAEASARSTSVEIAFSFSGRLSVRTQTCPSRRTCTSALMVAIVSRFPGSLQLRESRAVTGDLLELTSEQLEIRRLCREFAEREIRPISLAVDEADTQMPWEIWHQAA